MKKFIPAIIFLVVVLGGLFLYQNKSNVVEERAELSGADVERVEETRPKTQSLATPQAPAQSVSVQSAPVQNVQTSVANPNEPPLKLKGIGVEFSDFVFVKGSQFNRLFMGFGFVIPANMSASGQSKPNPQPTFIVPLGTPVRSIVDGVVANIATVWSGDYSIQVTANGKMEKWIYETEHVINPKVKVGDRVVAGQVIAEVSNFNSGAPAGYGTVEIGILRGGQVPEHVCPFAYLDSSVKVTVLANIRDLFSRWEAYAGDTTLYDESEPVPGCVTLEAIPG